MMLPPDLLKWVPKDDMVRFVLEAVEAIPQTGFEVNYRGTGSAQQPPQMLLALLIYCYSQGAFSSLRRRNGEAITAAFKQVLKPTREMGVLRVGTVCLDGTHVKANRSKHRSVRYDRARR